MLHITLHEGPGMARLCSQLINIHERMHVVKRLPRPPYMCYVIFATCVTVVSFFYSLLSSCGSDLCVPPKTSGASPAPPALKISLLGKSTRSSKRKRNVSFASTGMPLVCTCA